LFSEEKSALKQRITALEATVAAGKTKSMNKVDSLVARGARKERTNHCLLVLA
jgi:hypothetical protein